MHKFIQQKFGFELLMLGILSQEMKILMQSEKFAHSAYKFQTSFEFFILLNMVFAGNEVKMVSILL